MPSIEFKTIGAQKDFFFLIQFLFLIVLIHLLTMANV